MITDTAARAAMKDAEFALHLAFDIIRLDDRVSDSIKARVASALTSVSVAEAGLPLD